MNLQPEAVTGAMEKSDVLTVSNFRGVAAFLDVRDLGGGIVGRAVQHRDRNHRGKISGEPAGEEDVEPAVLAASGGIHVLGRVPRVRSTSLRDSRGSGPWHPLARRQIHRSRRRFPR